ncbi:hypothetical protein F4805DRAFT_465123 [Annulohypoxylon moriforme]|nr:hypothetical protein F4805DRAFT_465123 [Annulohypoxylon moriforme]
MTTDSSLTCQLFGTYQPTRITSTAPSRSNSPHIYRRCENYKPQSSISEGEETLSAHISLFHALPGSSLNSIRSDIAAAVACIKPFQIRAMGPPIRMGRGGVSVSVTGLRPVEELVKDLQAKWRDVLSPQDRRPFCGHYTLMNKEKDPGKVAQCLQDICHELPSEGYLGTAIGLSLWRYDNGWWLHKEDFAFSKVENDK